MENKYGITAQSECFYVCPNMHKNDAVVHGFFSQFLGLGPGESEIEYGNKMQIYYLKLASDKSTMKMPLPSYFGIRDGKVLNCITSEALEETYNEYCKKSKTCEHSDVLVKEMKQIMDAALGKEVVVIHGVDKVYGLWQKIKGKSKEESDIYEMLENFEEPMPFKEAWVYFVKKYGTESGGSPDQE